MQVEQQILEAKKSLQQVSNIIIHYFSKPVKSVTTAEIKASCLSTVVISLRVSLDSTVVIYSHIIIIITYFLWADEFVPSIVSISKVVKTFSTVVRGMKLSGFEMTHSLDLTCRVKKRSGTQLFSFKSCRCQTCKFHAHQLFFFGPNIAELISDS